MKLLTLFLAFSLTTAAFAQELAWHTPNAKKEVIQPSFSISGLTFAFTDSYTNSSIRIIDMQSGEVRMKFSDFENQLIRTSICLADDNTLVYATSGSNTIVKIEIATGTKTVREIPDYYIQAISPISDNLFIVSTVVDGKPRYIRYDFANNEFSEAMTEVSNIYQPITFSNDRSKLLTSGVEEVWVQGARRSFRVIDTETMEPIFESEKELRMMPISFIDRNSSILMINGGLLDTTINGNQGNYSFTEITEYDENYEQIRYEMMRGEYAFVGNKSMDDIYLYERFRKMLYTYNLPSDSFIDSIKTDIGQFMQSAGTQTYSLNRGKLITRNENYQEQSSVALFDGNLHNSEITGVGNLDANSLITGSRFGIIKRWDMSTGSFIDDYLDVGDDIRNMSTSNNKEMLGVCTQSSFKLFKGKDLLDEIELDVALDCKFSQDDKMVVISSYNDELVVYDIEKGEIRNRFDAGSWIRTCEFLDNDRVVVGFEKSIVIYDIESGNELDSKVLFQSGFANSVEDIKLSPDGSKFSVCTNWDVFYVFDAANTAELFKIYSDKIIDNGSSYFQGASWTSDSENILIYTVNRVALVNTITEEVYFSTNEIDGEALTLYERINNAFVSQDDKYLVFTTDYGRMAAFLNPLIEVSVEQQDNQSFNIYPNPATTSIRLDGNFEGYNFELIDMQGRTMNSGQLQNNSIPLQDLPAGSYLLRLSNGSDLRIQKVMKR